MNRKDTTSKMDNAEKKRKKLEIARERRHQSALERLGTNNPRCVRCGNANWRCLEKHHIAGQAFGDFTCIYCRNCHREVSDLQKDHPDKIGAPVGFHEALGHFLLGLADFFELLIRRLREFGNALIEGLQAQDGTGEVRT